MAPRACSFYSKLRVRAQEPEFRCWRAALAFLHRKGRIMNLVSTNREGTGRTHLSLEDQWNAVVQRKRALLEREVAA